MSNYGTTIDTIYLDKLLTPIATGNMEKTREILLEMKRMKMSEVVIKCTAHQAKLEVAQMMEQIFG